MPRLERLFKTQAIILRRFDYGEADRILTLLTADHGKLRAIAKGARKLTSRLNGHLELYSRAALLIAHGHELHVISQAEQQEAFLPLHSDLMRSAYAHHIAELTDRFSEHEEAQTPFFNLLNAALGWLCAPEADLALIARYFELRLLHLSGFAPSLFECAIGQEPLTARDQFFSAAEGGAICPEHARGYAVQPLSLDALKVLRYMARTDYESVRHLRLSPALHAELDRTLSHYLLHLLEQRLKSAEFVRQLRARLL
ncbi:MAG: DNA repair protein RecO [Candidatus Thermofonsia Clade 1 bacterium]|jgi:DNA repair protein RecO (recombination protein O)|uniref:DNA repair protein RecO n=1 Tax=Candidatus Thermofonsia Clade 1 bacterium TaxID=2364210 RepID=A0A2M8PD53_9CHLR|nr:MAG: DNA repair protein RecO [Candidatus Thermofonsia Clade 1 bacterium]RMF53350.1 MAG: DNA repair protein RecO [Chloroflexota bacterium]